MDTTGTRLKEFLEKKEIEQKTVAIAMNVSAPYINALCTGKTGIGKKTAARLQELYGVSAAWLLTGEGNMIADGEQYDEELRPIRSTVNGKPYFNVDFEAGFDIMENDQTRTPEYLIDFAPYNNCDMWCNARGNSMYPTIASGDIVALKRVNDFSFLVNGEIYAIVTTNGLRTIKRVRDNGDTITLIPDNKEVAEQTIPKALLRAVFQIKGSFKCF